MSFLQRALHRLPPDVRKRLKSLPGAEQARAVLAGRPSLPGAPSGSKRPVVYLPTWVRWDSMRQRPQYLLQAFADHGHPVYFVDPREDGSRVVDGVTIVCSVDDVPRGSVILYVHFAPMRHLFDRFEDPVIVYDLLDDLSIYDEDETGLPEERRVRAHHPIVMQRAHSVIVSNEVLAETHRAERSDLIHVPNGVNAELFATLVAPPADLLRDARPIVGYHGMISHWFDFDLLTEVAAERPDFRFVLVGPHDPRVADRVERLSRISNVELLGERPSSTMPSYVQAFDVGTVWFQVNDLTRAVTPLKVYEYLAAGKAVVSTPLPACEAEPTVRTAPDARGFAAALDECLRDPDVDRRVAAGRQNDWRVVIAPLLADLEAKGLLRVP
jgi:glycosyltransferase involved in cell wall biosynthesis